MKKKYLAVLLAAAMMVCSGCSVTDVLNNINSSNNEVDEDDEDEDIDEEDDNDDSEQDSTGEGENITDEVTNGPACVVVGYNEGYYYEHLTMSVGCENVQILNPGFDLLQRAINDIYEFYYEDTLGYWNYDVLDDMGADEYGDEYSTDGFGQAEWNYNSCVSVVRNDSQLFSMEVATNSYLGGAHDYTDIMSYNIDPKTGEVLKLSDVVNDYDALYDIIHDLLTAEYDTDAEFYPEWETTLHDKVYYESYFSEGMDRNWTAYEDGITFYFNGYELAPWAAGLISVKMSLDNNSDMLKAEYFHKAGEVVHVYDAPDNGRTDFTKTVLRDMIDVLGEWNFIDCTAYLEEHNWEYECNIPYESETSGDIWVVDPDTGLRNHFGFWPLDENSGVYGIEYDALSDISYNISDYTVIIDNFYNTTETRYRLVDTRTYDVVWFNTQDDLWDYLGYLMNK